MDANGTMHHAYDEKTVLGYTMMLMRCTVIAGFHELAVRLGNCLSKEFVMRLCNQLAPLLHKVGIDDGRFVIPGALLRLLIDHIARFIPPPKKNENDIEPQDAQPWNCSDQRVRCNRGEIVG